MFQETDHRINYELEEREGWLRLCIMRLIQTDRGKDPQTKQVLEEPNTTPFLIHINN